jgi:hypothetical protein
VRILLDECIDRRLARDLPTHEVRTVPRMGWASFRNGDLLRLAQDSFDVFLTVDQHVGEQQSVRLYRIAVVVLRSRSTQWQELRRLVPALLEALPEAPKGAITWIG